MSQKVNVQGYYEGLFTEFCPKMVASAVDILEEIIEEMQKKI